MEEKKYGVILLDRGSASIGILDGDNLTVIWEKQSLVPARETTEGYRRFERLIEIAIHEWFETVTRVAKHGIFRLYDLDAIFVSGSSAERLVTHYL